MKMRQQSSFQSPEKNVGFDRARSKSQGQLSVWEYIDASQEGEL